MIASGDFSVRKGTIFYRSRLPLRKWFAAVWLYNEHPKGISSPQLAKQLGVQQRTAWYVLAGCGRTIREEQHEWGPAVRRCRGG